MSPAVDLSSYVTLSALLFFIGVAGVILRRNPLVMLMGIELMLNAANLAFVAFSRAWGNNAGQIFSFIVIIVAAAEAAIGLAITVVVFNRSERVDVDDVTLLKG
jgi:NADH-quinone oxidoreductase subunit K